MFHHQLAEAISGASLSSLDEISRAFVAAYGAGTLSDHDAQIVSDALEARRSALKARAAQYALPACPARPRPCRSPDKARSIERRRRVAMSGALPASLATAFTLSEIAVLSVIAREVKRHGSCALPLDQIAALAGTCRTKARQALRQAARLNLIHVQERRRRGMKSQTNIVLIISTEWRKWLEIGGIGGRKKTTTESNVYPQKSQVKIYEYALDQRLKTLDSASARQLRTKAHATGHKTE